MMRPYAQYRDTPLWKALASVLTELEANGEVRIDTAPEYVIGYFCRELEAKSVIAPTALAQAP